MLKRLLCGILVLCVSLTMASCSSEAEWENMQIMEESLHAGRERQEAIQNSETHIIKSTDFIPGETYSGTAYYISNGGDDSYDGLTPETAWATIGRANRANLGYGDAVFMERGGIWRGETVETKPGVTYSAYGTGEKPQICASPENGADEAFWSLYWEGPNQEKVWLYHRDMPDCGNIVLDEQQATQKVLGFWDGTQFLQYMCENNGNNGGFDIGEQLAQPVFDVKEQLSEDMTFFSRADSTLPDTLPIFMTGWNVDEGCYAQTSIGPLYFRCDAGNPGELYQSIEFQTHTPLFDNVAEGCVLDNLFVGYAGDGVLTVNEGDNVTVQNCEVGWVGGIVGSYNNGDEMTGYGVGIQRLAGALGTSGSGTHILNNYVHDMYHAGGGIEIFEEQKGTLKCTTDVLIKGNLFTHCASGVTFFNWDDVPNPEHQFKNCIYEDNYIMFTGLENWLDTGYAPAFVHEGGPNMQEGCIVRNNTFFVARTALVYIQHYVPEYFPDFTGNTYIQHQEFPFIMSEEADIGEIYSAEEALQILNDTEGVIVTIKNIPDGL